MKKILLSSAAIVAFAGAAAAEVTFSGSATLGYNDEHEGGFFADSDLDISMSQELNNGWTAAVTFGLELENMENGELKTDGTVNNYDHNLLISLTNGAYGIHYGETSYAAESLWDGVSEMTGDAFSEQDDEAILKLTATFGDIETAYSVAIDNDDSTFVGGGAVAATGEAEIGQQSFGAAGSLGNFTFALGYQDETTQVPSGADGDGLDGDFFFGEVIGLTVGSSFAGADVKMSYAKASSDVTDEAITSLGLEVAYPVGPVTLTAFYVDESYEDGGDGSFDFDSETYGVSAAYAQGPLEATLAYQSVLEVEEISLEGSYAVSDELSVFAGYIDSDDEKENGSYIGVEYDLGGGASVVASYADVNEDDDNPDFDNSGDDEFGAQDYKAGATIALSLSF